MDVRTALSPSDETSQVGTHTLTAVSGIVLYLSNNFCWSSGFGTLKSVIRRMGFDDMTEDVDAASVQ